MIAFSQPLHGYATPHLQDFARRPTHMGNCFETARKSAARVRRARGDPAMGSPRMEVKKLGRNYSQLLQMLLEHAQMEDKVVFPILESADRDNKVARRRKMINLRQPQFSLEKTQPMRNEILRLRKIMVLNETEIPPWKNVTSMDTTNLHDGETKNS